jgi:hypothetical protein
MIRGLLLIAQALIWLLLLRFLMRTLGAVFGRGQAGPRPRGRPQVRAPEDLVLDRVCHTYVPRSRALTARVSGHEEWFCSAACREQALAAVARAS